MRGQCGPRRRFVVKTYVEARSAVEALKVARRTLPDDVLSLEDDKDGRGGGSVSAVGFSVGVSREDDDE